MAKIADLSDIDIQWVTTPVDITQVGDEPAPDMLEMYCFASGRPSPPEEFTAKDRFLLLELIMYGECAERPRDEVIAWAEKNPTIRP